MATTSPSRSDTYAEAVPRRGHGWVLFAGTMLALVGTLNVIYGIAAISNSKFYVRDVTYIFGSLNTWGWFLLVVGTIQFLAALSIWGGTEWGRWVGVISAMANALLQMFALPGYPFLSITLFTVDILEFEGASSGLLGDTDAAKAADSIEPGSAAVMIVYENRWAAPFADAVRRNGGEMIANVRITVDDLVAALDAAEAAA